LMFGAASDPAHQFIRFVGTLMGSVPRQIS
jgi:hypothetical protein